MNTVIELNEKKKELISKLRFGGKKDDELLNQIREIEQQVKQIERVKSINDINLKYSKLREKAAKVWECEQVTEDITTEGGSFHKTKVKKYPVLASLDYVRGKFKDGVLFEISLSGESFRMFNVKCEYGKPEQYSRPASFALFLELNSIPLKDLTLQEFEQIETKLNELNSNLEKAISEYKLGLEFLNASSFRYWGYLGQSNENLYKTDLKF
jgi:hypothetical protein